MRDAAIELHNDLAGRSSHRHRQTAVDRDAPSDPPLRTSAGTDTFIGPVQIFAPRSRATALDSARAGPPRRGNSMPCHRGVLPTLSPERFVVIDIEPPKEPSQTRGSSPCGEDVLG